MQFIMDMVHDNPGEERFKTEFRNPKKLVGYGYNTQVFKHANTVISFDCYGEDFFPTEEGKKWLANMTATVKKELSDAKKCGLMTMSHIDLFVLPKLLVEKFQDEICDENGKISVFKEKTKELHRKMFDEMFEKYPIDGLVVRVGETYLFDTPFHIGNGAVEYGDVKREKEAFVELINFLAEEVCRKHGKFLIFRTWDLFPDKFHADLEYYLDITDKIEPCEKLIFSIKHTALDFWRNVKFNPCLGKGKHRQVVEVQCQREYEGKGAYPMYVMEGIINGFTENKVKLGLKDIAKNPLICGIYAWSRGGGWNGPYIQNEFWCDINAFVIAQYANAPEKSEEEIFLQYTQKYMGMDEENSKRFHELCLMGADAVLYGRYIAPYDKSLNESNMPAANWLRDDDIGGLRQLNEVFDYLEKNNFVEEAIAEKEYSVNIWKEMKEHFKEIDIPDFTLSEFIENSIEYGLRFFTIVDVCMKIFAKCRKKENVKDLLQSYDEAWASYKELEKRNQASSSYNDDYKFGNGLGLNETIEYCRKNLC